MFLYEVDASELARTLSDCCLFTKAAFLLLFAEQRDAHLTRIISIVTQSRWQLIPRYIRAPPMLYASRRLRVSFLRR